jgi:hypothetical protein
VPTTAVVDGALAEATTADSVDVLVGVDTSTAQPALVGAVDERDATAELAAGVVHMGTPLDGAWRLRVGDEDVAGRLGFGVTTAYDVDAPGSAELGYRSPSSRTVWLIVQALLWLVALVAASRLTVPRRMRVRRTRDETIIDLDAEPQPADRTGFAGWVDELFADEADDAGMAAATPPAAPSEDAAP